MGYNQINFKIFLKKFFSKRYHLNLNVFDIVVTFIIMIKKKYFIKSIFSWSWFDIYICLIKTVIEIEVE